MARSLRSVGLDVCLCDPHSLWQCATNENTPGSCVNYMPKGSGRWPLSEADLDVIADQRGERPGKTPNWDAPKQRLELLLRT